MLRLPASLMGAVQQSIWFVSSKVGQYRQSRQYQEAYLTTSSFLDGFALGRLFPGFGIRSKSSFQLGVLFPELAGQLAMFYVDRSPGRLALLFSFSDLANLSFHLACLISYAA